MVRKRPKARNSRQLASLLSISRFWTILLSAPKPEIVVNMSLCLIERLRLMVLSAEKVGKLVNSGCTRGRSGAKDNYL